MTTAAQLITKSLHLFGIVDQTESPSATDIANGVTILNDLLRAEQADGACQYLINRISVDLPPGTVQQIYQFYVGIADPSYLVKVDAVAVRSIWMNDISLTTSRPTRMAPMDDVLRTTQPGRITKWHQERQADGAVRVTAWQPPSATSKALIEYGGRVPELTATDGSDTVTLPPEGIHDATLLFGRRVMGSYGRVLPANDPIIMDAERANLKWRNWARGQQWLQFVRS